MLLDQIRFLLGVDFSASASLPKQKFKREGSFLILIWWLPGNLDALELQVLSQVNKCFYPCPMLHRQSYDYSTPSPWRRAGAWLIPLGSSAEGQASLLTNQSCECFRHEHGPNWHMATRIRKSWVQRSTYMDSISFPGSIFHSQPTRICCLHRSAMLFARIARQHWCTSKAVWIQP